MNEFDRKNPEKFGPASPSAGQAEPASIHSEVTRTYLEISSLTQLVPGQPPSVSATLQRIGPCTVDTWRALYALRLEAEIASGPSAATTDTAGLGTGKKYHVSTEHVILELSRKKFEAE